MSDPRRQLGQRDQLEGKMIGRSPGMQKVRSLVAELATSAADVLIHGKTGTCNELVVHCLHEANNQRDRNLVAINYGGPPEAQFDIEIFGHKADPAAVARTARIPRSSSSTSCIRPSRAISGRYRR